MLSILSILLVVIVVVGLLAALGYQRQGAESRQAKPYDPDDWQAAFEGLGAPPPVLAWAQQQGGDFDAAWAACDDPFVRVWLARAGGASQRDIVAGVAQILVRASDTAVVPPEVATLVGDATTVLLGYLQGDVDDAERDDASSRAFQLAIESTGTATDLLHATEMALKAAQAVANMDLPHDGIWLMHASLAVKMLVSGFRTDGLVSATEASDLLSAGLQPPGAAPERSDELSLANYQELTDPQIVGRAYLRIGGAEGDDGATVQQAVACTIDLELEVQNGGFGQFFLNHGVKAADAAESAYQLIERSDLAALVREACRVAKGSRRKALIGHPGFGELDSRFLEALEEDPTSARASYIRAHIEQF